MCVLQIQSSTKPPHQEKKTTLSPTHDASDSYLGRVEAEHDGSAVVLLAGDALDVDDVLLSVHAGDLAVAVLEGTADDLDLVILADGEGAHVVLLLELLGQGSAHDLSTSLGVGAEVLLAGLTPGRVLGLVEFHPLRWVWCRGVGRAFTCVEGDSPEGFCSRQSTTDRVLRVCSGTMGAKQYISLFVAGCAL